VLSSHSIVISAGQSISGSSVSSTVTVNVQLEELPDASVAVTVTVAVPTGKNEPLGGLNVRLSSSQLSVAEVSHALNASAARVDILFDPTVFLK
jgi:hypothetical protein